MRRLVQLICALACLVALVFAMPVHAKVTIELWEPWNTTAIKEALAPFLAQNPDIEVNTSHSGQSTAQKNKFVTAAAAGVSPDIILFVSPIGDYAMQGLLTPLDNMLAASQVIKAKDYPAGMLDLFKYNGATYGVPAVEVGPWLGMTINADVMETAGIPARSPRSLEELMQVHNKLTRVENGVITQLGFSPLSAMGDLYSVDTWSAIFDQTVYDPVKQTLAIDTQKMRNMYNYVRSFHDAATAEQIWAFHTKNTWGNGTHSGRLAMQMTGYWAPGAALSSGASERYKFMWDWVPNINGNKLMIMGGWGMAIPKGAAHPKEAFRIIEYFTGLEAAQHIYNKHGWLNGNLNTMRRLDTGKNTGIMWYMQALSTADRLRTTENIPIMSEVRAQFKTYNWNMVKKLISPEQSLTELQKSLQAKLDEVVGRK